MPLRESPQVVRELKTFGGGIEPPTRTIDIAGEFSLKILGELAALIHQRLTARNYDK